MARALDVADVPALLEAMVGWLDPAVERRGARRAGVHGAAAPPTRCERRAGGRPRAARCAPPPLAGISDGGGGPRRCSWSRPGCSARSLFHPASPVAQALPDPLAAARADGPDHGPDRDRHHLLALGPAVGRAHQSGGDADLLAARQGRDLGRDLLRARPVRGRRCSACCWCWRCSARPSPTRRSATSRPCPGRPARWSRCSPRRRSPSA